MSAPTLSFGIADPNRGRGMEKRVPASESTIIISYLASR